MCYNHTRSPTPQFIFREIYIIMKLCHVYCHYTCGRGGRQWQQPIQMFFCFFKYTDASLVLKTIRRVIPLLVVHSTILTAGRPTTQGEENIWRLGRKWEGKDRHSERNSVYQSTQRCLSRRSFKSTGNALMLLTIYLKSKEFRRAPNVMNLPSIYPNLMRINVSVRFTK